MKYEFSYVGVFVCKSLLLVEDKASGFWLNVIAMILDLKFLIGYWCDDKLSLEFQQVGILLSNNQVLQI